MENESAKEISEVQKKQEEELAKLKADQIARQEAAKKYQEERMEKIVIFCREKVLPFLKNKNLSIEKSKQPLEVLAVTIQQSLHNMMEKTKVSELGLIEMVSLSRQKNPDNGLGDLAEILDVIKDDTMQDAVESLQWMVSKIDATIKEENKKRDFASLNLDF